MSGSEGYINQRRPRYNRPFPKVDDSGLFRLQQLFWYRGGASQNSTFRYPLEQKTYSFRSGLGGGYETDPKLLIKQSSDRTLRPHDTGHEFSTELDRLNTTHESYTGFGINGTRIFGALMSLDVQDYLGLPFDNRYQFGDIDLGVGTDFLSRLRPTKSAANVAQALLELLVDVPRIPFDAITKDQARARLLKRGSAEYLNIVFGWAPLVGDVLKFCRAIVFADKILQQYRRDSGKRIRRRSELPENLVTVSSPPTTVGTTLSLGGVVGDDLFSNYSSDSVGQQTITHQTSETYSFSGAFSYLLTGDENFYDKMAEFGRFANKLLGVKISIDVLWQVAPWSWLSDWFTSIGSIIDVNNSIAQDNLVIQYGYLMRHSRYVRTWNHDGITFANSGHTGPLRTEYIRTKKERVRATPYGFGINPGALTEQQWAILIALGLTKGDKKFWWG